MSTKYTAFETKQNKKIAVHASVCTCKQRGSFNPVACSTPVVFRGVSAQSRAFVSVFFFLSNAFFEENVMAVRRITLWCVRGCSCLSVYVRVNAFLCGGHLIYHEQDKRSQRIYPRPFFRLFISHCSREYLLFCVCAFIRLCLCAPVHQNKNRFSTPKTPRNT